MSVCPDCEGGTLYVEFRDPQHLDERFTPPPGSYGQWIVCQNCGYEFPAAVAARDEAGDE